MTEVNHQSNFKINAKYLHSLPLEPEQTPLDTVFASKLNEHYTVDVQSTWDQLLELLRVAFAAVLSIMIPKCNGTKRKFMSRTSSWNDFKKSNLKLKLKRWRRKDKRLRRWHIRRSRIIYIYIYIHSHQNKNASKVVLVVSYTKRVETRPVLKYFLSVQKYFLHFHTNENGGNKISSHWDIHHYLSTRRSLLVRKSPRRCSTTM